MLTGLRQPRRSACPGRPGPRAHAGWSPPCNDERVSSPRLEWTVAGCLAGWAAARLTAADRLRPLEPVAVPLLALTPQATVAALLAALLLRGRGPSATAALSGAAMAVVLAPRAIPRRQPPADGPVLHILTVNLLTRPAAGREAGWSSWSAGQALTCCFSRNSTRMR